MMESAQMQPVKGMPSTPRPGGGLWDRASLHPIAVATIGGAVLGVGLIHPTAAFAMHVDLWSSPLQVLATAFSAPSFPLLLYHALMGALVGLAGGLAADRIYQRRLQEQERVRQLENQLHHAQRMESIGRLAAGVAHDFNNLLTALNVDLQLARETVPEGAEAATFIEDAQKVADKAGHMPRQLLAFSRRQSASPRIVEPSDVVQGLVKLLRNLLGDEVTLETRLDSRGRVRIDPGHLEQVVVNLCVNARDAMPRGGRLLISTRDRELAAGDPSGLPEGSYVSVSVKDSGSGIPPEVLARIFEPFFTTKGEGKGTGLGLSTCYGIARQNGGAMLVESKIGAGSEFTILLPRTQASDASRGGPSQPQPLPRGSENVLVVDDRDEVREAISNSLRRLGYTVLAARNGEEALALARAPFTGPIHLLLADVSMPGMSGTELATRLGRDRPGLRVLLMSGHDPSILGSEPTWDSSAFVAKPIDRGDLARRVRLALDA